MYLTLQLKHEGSDYVRRFGATTRDNNGFPIFGASFDHCMSLVLRRTRLGWKCEVVENVEEALEELADDEDRKEYMDAGPPGPELYTWVHFRPGDDLASDYPPPGPGRWRPLGNTAVETVQTRF